MNKVAKFGVIVVSFLAGFGVGVLVEEMQIKKKAEKYVKESLNSVVKEETLEKNQELNNEINKKQPQMEVFETLTRPYKSSEEPKNEEKIVSKAVEIVEKEGDLAENASPFRPKSVSNKFGKIVTCTENEFLAADSREEIVYYTDDECFYNADGSRIEDPESTFGGDVLDYFGTTSDDPDLVHIYSKDEDVYYEIQRKLGHFDSK